MKHVVLRKKEEKYETRCFKKRTPTAICGPSLNLHFSSRPM
jgi:hypothetical protein